MSLGTKHSSWAGSAGCLALRLLVLALSAGWAQAAPVSLAPQGADNRGAGTGLDATFLRIDSAWRGSTVLWEEGAPGAKGTYGKGVEIGGLPWGTGLWGRRDFDTIQAAGASFFARQPSVVLDGYADRVAQINFGNSRYNQCYGSSQQWGPVELPRFFTETLGNDPVCKAEDGSVSEQTNWTARFSGFLRVTDPGSYWFSVLNDDGFFFRLIGEAGTEVGAERDFLNPRERSETMVSLEQGLYGVELGAWNRLGAGVVDFRWRTSATVEWNLVPTANLLSSQSVPEPGLPALLGGAAAAWWLTRRRVPIAMHVGSA